MLRARIILGTHICLRYPELFKATEKPIHPKEKIKVIIMIRMKQAVSESYQGNITFL